MPGYLSRLRSNSVRITRPQKNTVLCAEFRFAPVIGFSHLKNSAIVLIVGPFSTLAAYIALPPDPDASEDRCEALMDELVLNYTRYQPHVYTDDDDTVVYIVSPSVGAFGVYMTIILDKLHQAGLGEYISHCGLKDPTGEYFPGRGTVVVHMEGYDNVAARVLVEDVDQVDA